MKYQIGIMSSKWMIEAPSLDIAVATMRIAQKTTAPVVCYNSREQSNFASHDWYTPDDFRQFADDNADEIRSAFLTMELV